MLTILQQRITRKILTVGNRLSSAKPSIYYFGYGANVDPDFLRRKISNIEHIGQARLDDHKFSFNTPCEYIGKGFGGLVRQKDSCLYGSLFLLNDSGMNLLDCLEWTQFKFYKRECLNVVCESGTVSAQVYIPCHSIEGLIPSKTYHQHLINGALKMGLPAEYIEFLRSFTHKEIFNLNHSFNLRNPGVKRMLSPAFYKHHDLIREKLCSLI